MDIRLFRISTRRSFSLSLADFRQPSFTNPFTSHPLLAHFAEGVVLHPYSIRPVHYHFHLNDGRSIRARCYLELLCKILHSQLSSRYPLQKPCSHTLLIIVTYIASLYQEDHVTYSYFRSAAVGNQSRSILQFDGQLPQKIFNIQKS
jgi:hypothetical protein